MQENRLHYIEVKQLADEIRKRVSLADFLQQEGIQLTSAGYKDGAEMLSCHCPLHKENTPSFRVYTHDQSWYCFGCQRGGDVVAFAKEIKGFGTWGQAVGFFAAKLGLSSNISNISLSEMAYEEFLKALCLNDYSELDANNINYLVSMEGKRITRKFKSPMVDSMISKVYQALDHAIVEQDQRGLSRIKNEVLPGIKILESSLENKRKAIEEVRKDNKSCTSCRLRYGCNNIVTGFGSYLSNVMFIFDSPLHEEESLGKGGFGREDFFDQLLQAGVEKENVWIDYIYNCRSNRNDIFEEKVSCKKRWLDKRIEILKPDAVMLIGSSAIKCFMENDNIDCSSFVERNRKHKMKNHEFDLYFSYSAYENKESFDAVLENFTYKHIKCYH